MTDAPTKHVFFARSRGDRRAFVSDAFARVVPRLRSLAPAALTVSLTERETPRATVIPFRRENLLMASVYGDIDPAGFEAALSAPAVEVFGYRVRESHPLRYEKTWSDGERSPGEVLLTLLARNRAISEQAFMHEWHGRHTPKALRIHPMWSYGRNVVVGRTRPDAPEFDGVVEEHYRRLDDILNPVRMFGGAARFLPQMVEVALHVRHFLDLGRTENYLLAEYVLVGA